MTANRNSRFVVLIIALLAAPSSIARAGWQTTYNGNANGVDVVYGLAIDGSGNVFAAGDASILNSGVSSRDIVLLKLSASTGAQLWSAPFARNGTANSQDHGYQVVLDGSGSAIIGGTVTNTGTGVDGVVIKVGSAGSATWTFTIDGAAHGSDAIADQRALAINSSGELAVASGVKESATGRWFTIYKLSAAGAQLWKRQISNGLTESLYPIANAITFDSSGNVIAVGSSLKQNAGVDSLDFTVVKYDSSGNSLWKKVNNGSGNSSDAATAVTIASNGDVIAAGYENHTSTGSDLVVRRYAASNGAIVWSYTLDGSNPPGSADSTSEVSYSLRTNSSGDVIVGGVINNASTWENIVVLKLRGSDGVELWRREIDGPLHHDDTIKDIAVDSSNNVYVTGIANYDPAGSTDEKWGIWVFTNVGDLVYTQWITGTVGESEGWRIAVDASGNIFSGGYTAETHSGGESDDITVVRKP